MRCVFLGPPGVGKGTQAELMAGRYGITKISTGDMFRDAITTKSEIGLRAKAFMDAGHLVPDSVVIGLVEERLSRGDLGQGFVLDGFPRTVPQAEALEEILARKGQSLDAVVLFQAPEEEIIRRISGRLYCPICQKLYHKTSSPPPTGPDGEPQCACGGKLVQRKDDRPETVRERLKVYWKETAPLADYYRAKGLLITVDATGSVEKVAQQLRDQLFLGRAHDHSQVERGDR